MTQRLVPRRIIILTQVLQYALFSVIVSSIVFHVGPVSLDDTKALYVLFLRILSSLLHLSIPFSFNLKTFLLALLLGIFVPLFAAIPSIRSMFRDIQHNARSDNNQVVEYHILSSKTKPILPGFVVLISGLVSLCGVCIYYFLPLGFISNNMTVRPLRSSFLDRVLCIHGHSNRIHRRTGSLSNATSSPLVFSSPAIVFSSLLTGHSLLHPPHVAK